VVGKTKSLLSKNVFDICLSLSSNSRSLFCVFSRMMSQVKLSFNQNLIMINHKSNDNFNCHIHYSWYDSRGIQKGLVILFMFPPSYFYFVYAWAKDM
jgi:hypothetical protein